MAGSLVLVDDALVGNRIYHADRGLECSLGGRFVRGADGFSHMLDRCSQLRTHAHIVTALRDVLSRAFSRLGAIGHVNLKFNAENLLDDTGIRFELQDSD